METKNKYKKIKKEMVEQDLKFDSMNKKNEKNFLAGHNGLVGSSILKLLKKRNIKKYLLKKKINLIFRSRQS